MFFRSFFAEPDLYRFEDMAIAEGSSSNWSYPSWPSHLDHILITDELFDDMENANSEIQVIKVGDYMDGGFNEYDAKISDHRPVAIKIELNEITTVGLDEEKEAIRMEAYPNPSSGEVFIKLNKELQGAMLEVYSTDGTRVAAFALDAFDGELQWNAEALPSGIYHLRVLDNNAVYASRKIVLKSAY